MGPVKGTVVSDYVRYNFGLHRTRDIGAHGIYTSGFLVQAVAVAHAPGEGAAGPAGGGGCVLLAQVPVVGVDLDARVLRLVAVIEGEVAVVLDDPALFVLVRTWQKLLRTDRRSLSNVAFTIIIVTY